MGCSLSNRRCHKLTGHRASLLAACSAVALLLAVPAAQADPPAFPYPDGSSTTFDCVAVYGVSPLGATSCSASTTHHETDMRVDLPDAVAYSTRVLGTGVVTGPGVHQSVTAFDQTAPEAPGSAAVNSLFGQASAAAHAEAMALAAGRPFVAITESGPTLTASSSTTGAAVLVSHSPVTGPYPGPVLFPPLPGGTTYAFVHSSNTDLTITNSTTIGPGTVLIGPDQTNSAFVPVGGQNTNTNIGYEAHFEDDFQATTTNTATYQIIDTILLELVGTIHPAVQSAAFDEGSRFLMRLSDEAGAEAPPATPMMPLGYADDPRLPALGGGTLSHHGWGEAYGTWLSDQGQGMVSGLTGRTGGFAGGFAFMAAPGLNLGFGVDQGWTAINETDSSGHADVSLTQFGLGASYTTGNWLLDTAALAGVGTATTSHDGTGASYGVTTWGAEGEVGYRFTADGWKLTPKAGLDYVSAHSDGFAEPGALGLSAAGYGAERTRGWLGIEAARSLVLGNGQSLDLTADARLVDVLSGRARMLPVTFAGSPMTVEGLTEGAFAGDFDVTAALHPSASTTLSLTGRAFIANNGDTGAAGRFGLAVAF